MCQQRRPWSWLWSARIVLCSLLFGLSATGVVAEDWPYWRGPRMDGVSAEKGLVHSWDPSGVPGDEQSNILWKRDDLGTRSSPVVFDNLVYIHARHDPGSGKEREKLVCLDAVSGDTIWERKFNVYLSDVPDTRVAWSAPTVDTATGNVYSLGVCGLFQCCDGQTGEVLWDHSLSEEFGLLTTYGGRTNFPIVFEDLVIISGVVIGWGEQAKPTHRFLAFDKNNGQCVWNSGTRPLPYDTTYSAPVLAAFNGEAALVFASGDGGVHAIQPRTGKSIWKYNVSSRGINTTPLVVGDTVYCGHPEENVDSTDMGALFALDGTGSGDLTGSPYERWRETELVVGRAAPLFVDKILYVVDDRAKMRLIDPDTGEENGLVRMGRMQRSSPVFIDGYIWNITNNGNWYILKPRRGKLSTTAKGRLRDADGANENVDGSIAVSNGRIFIPTSAALYCVSSGNRPTDEEPVDLREKEANTTDTSVAHVQVVPTELMLYPGATVDFQVRLFNAKGQFLRMAQLGEAVLSVEGQGALTNNRFTVPDNATHGQFTVTASFDGETGTARGRIIPALEWEFDFNDGQVPVQWVGMRYRHVVLDGDLLADYRKRDPVAADLYVYLHSSLVNSGAPKLTFNNSTPAQKWTNLLSFFGLNDGEDAVRDLRDAERSFERSLERLVRDGVLGSAELTEREFKNAAGETVTEPQLVVTPGNRPTKNGVMCKIRTIPKGARSQGWMGHDDFSSYTVQADVMGWSRNDQMPDIGLVGQRYTLDLMGAKQQLQVRTWTPQLQMAQQVPFEWSPDTWYTLKFQTDLSGPQAVLKGKVWKKGEKEPDQWLVEATDDIPNTQGSPGFFGNAKTSEVFYDNVTVTKHAMNP